MGNGGAAVVRKEGNGRRRGRERRQGQRWARVSRMGWGIADTRADSVNEIVRPWGLPSVEQIGTVSEFGRCALRALRLCFRAQKCSRKWLRKYMCNHKHACTRTNTHAHTQATITHRRQAASQAISGLLFEEPKFSILAASGFGTHLS